MFPIWVNLCMNYERSQRLPSQLSPTKGERRIVKHISGSHKTFDGVNLLAYKSNKFQLNCARSSIIGGSDATTACSCDSQQRLAANMRVQRSRENGSNHRV